MDGIAACSLCKEQFENMFTLTTHMKDRHCSEPEKDVKKFDCDQCDYKGRSQSLLDCHVLTVHLSIFRSSCILCNFVTGCQGRDSPIVEHYSSTKNSSFVTCVNSA
jgi:hypothetical protein